MHHAASSPEWLCSEGCLGHAVHVAISLSCCCSRRSRSLGKTAMHTMDGLCLGGMASLRRSAQSLLMRPGAPAMSFPFPDICLSFLNWVQRGRLYDAACLQRLGASLSAKNQC